MTGGWRIAVRNLSRNRRRNVATGLAIAVGYASLVILGGYSNYAYEGMGALTVYLQRFGHVSIHKPGGLARAAAKPSAYSFTAEEQRAIAGLLAADPRVELAGRYLRAGGLAGNGCKSVPFVATGVEPEVEQRLLVHPRVQAWAPERARPVEGAALSGAAGEEAQAALAVGYAKKLRKHPSAAEPTSGTAPLDCAAGRADGDPWIQLAAIDFDGGFNALDARVTSLYRAVLYEEDKTSLMTDLPTLQRLLATDRVTSFAVYLRDPEDAPAVARDLAGSLERAGIAAELHRFDDPAASPYYTGTLAMTWAIVGFVGILVVIVAAISMLNAMTLTILERTRELATFRSLGFTRRQVTGLFLREATALTALGIAAGLGLGLLVSAAVGAAHVEIEPSGIAGTIPLRLVPTPAVCVGAAIAYFPCSLAATWLAVRRSVGRPVVQLLTAVTA
ncbi:MAG TPA: FtsX-like permease family protein [Anaeromyxobacteraceae bacterium]|nr:FtsX-like permease family protein [Anaeromyxobacteraceae bacterium]